MYIVNIVTEGKLAASCQLPSLHISLYIFEMKPATSYQLQVDSLKSHLHLQLLGEVSCQLPVVRD
jgi:hypothetical protein